MLLPAAAFSLMGKRDGERGNGRRKADGSEVDKIGQVWYNGQTDELLDKTKISVYRRRKRTRRMEDKIKRVHLEP